MLRWKGRVVLVTGASEGIGESICRALVAHGMQVAGCARSLAKLEVVKEELKDEAGTFLPIKCDVGRESEILSMFEVIKEKLGALDVCINNAGVGRDASLLSGSTDHWREMIDVNVLAVSICTRESVKVMRENGVDDGHIINISSLGGHRVRPPAATHFYEATKFALRALGEGLRHELREIGSHIRVTSMSPGMVETRFVDKMLADDPQAAERIHRAAGKVHDILLRPTEQAS